MMTGSGSGGYRRVEMADYIDREEVLKHKAILYDPLNTRGCSYVVTTQSIMKRG